MVFQNPICIFFVKMQIEKYLEQIGFLLNGSTDEYQTLVHTTKFNLLMSFRHIWTVWARMLKFSQNNVFKT